MPISTAYSIRVRLLHRMLLYSIDGRTEVLQSRFARSAASTMQQLDDFDGVDIVGSFEDIFNLSLCGHCCS